jgi:hypothetical protein
METLVCGIQRPQTLQKDALEDTVALPAHVNYFVHFLLSWPVYVSSTSVRYKFRMYFLGLQCYDIHLRRHLEGHV